MKYFQKTNKMIQDQENKQVNPLGVLKSGQKLRITDEI